MYVTTDDPIAHNLDAAHDEASVHEVLIDEMPDDELNQRGASLVEYALLVALIALVCIAAVTLLGGTTASQFSSIAEGLS